MIVLRSSSNGKRTPFNGFLIRLPTPPNVLDLGPRLSVPLAFEDGVGPTATPRPMSPQAEAFQVEPFCTF